MTETGKSAELESALYETLFPVHDLGDKLVGQIAESIGREIVSGKLRPGAFLDSVGLAKRFKTSRTPVREALMTLEKEGLVVIPLRRRPQVAGVSLKQVEEAYHIRELLYVDAVDQILRNSTDAELAELTRICDVDHEARLRGDVVEAFRLQTHFNDVFLTLTKNETLKKILYRLRLYAVRIRYAIYMEPGEAEHYAELNRQLALALVARNAPLAKGFVQTVMRQPTSLLAAGALKRLTEDVERPKVQQRPGKLARVAEVATRSGRPG